MMVIMLSFRSLINKKENTVYFEKYVLTEKDDKKYKEFMLTFLNEFIKTNVISIDKDGIKNYFRVYGEKVIASYEKSNIKYSLDKDSFILTYQYEDGILKKDQYNYEVINGFIKYTYRSSTYESGKLT
jgi:hypothetical protein